MPHFGVGFVLVPGGKNDRRKQNGVNEKNRMPIKHATIQRGDDKKAIKERLKFNAC